MEKKWVYLFEEGSAEMRDLLGGKGAGVAEMTRAGLPVPPGFTITTEACNAFYTSGRQFPAGMWDQAIKAVRELEAKSGKKFGDPTNPLLVSVRSGAKFSMPGMMDTVLNLGLNESTVTGLAKLFNDERFAYDSYRRFIQMFGKIVLDIDPEKFEHDFDDQKKKAGVTQDTELSAADLKEVVAKYKQLVKAETGEEFPSDPYKQMEKAIMAVFQSWNNKRAIDYRNYHGIPHDLGTAVNVQMMAFGNMGFDCGTGVAFTRDPSTGEKKIYGEYLLNAQGEDVVAGIRTPHKIDVMQQELPVVHKQFVEIAQRLERHYRDVQDMEFTVEKGKLFMLQTRSAKRTAQAAVKVAVDMVNEGLISKEEAMMRVEPGHIEQLLHRRIDPSAKLMVVAKGLNASPGAASGQAVFTADRAEEVAKSGARVILVRPETNPDDVHGMIVAQGILTARGGATSHAAVVARGLGKPCVAGCEEIKVDVANRRFSVDNVVVHEGEVISINGSTGEVILGEVPMIEPEMSGELRTLLGWADELKRLMVWANADYPRDARKARENGAQGIGLCRTEHMFFEEDRLPVVREMILAETEEVRQAALNKLLPIQKEDFKGIFRAMDGYPVVIRLIDPPLHEFLPSYEELLVEVTRLRERAKQHPEPSERMKVTRPTAEAIARHEAQELAEKEHLLKKVGEMREMNPMLGLRGCRLGIMMPGIIEMQVRAIMTAALEVEKEGVQVHPEIMIPLVGHVNELGVTREHVLKVMDELENEAGKKLSYKFGTMIEIPRAALTAGQIAEYAEFFSFGTNDLTQTTFGFSRDDAEGKFLLQYVNRGILPVNPFQTLDRDGVGRLMRLGVEAGRKTRSTLELGICGEHGGDPSSIEFCHELGLNYVSCSPFRVPVARLAAAQAAVSTGQAVSRTA